MSSYAFSRSGPWYYSNSQAAFQGVLGTSHIQIVDLGLVWGVISSGGLDQALLDIYAYGIYSTIKNGLEGGKRPKRSPNRSSTAILIVAVDKVRYWPSFGSSEREKIK